MDQAQKRTRILFMGTRHASTTTLSRLLLDADPNVQYYFEPDHEAGVGNTALLETLWCNASAYATRHGECGKGISSCPMMNAKKTLSGWGNFGYTNWPKGPGCHCQRPRSHCSSLPLSLQHCSTIQECTRLAEHCRTGKVRSLKSIHYDGALGAIFRRFCNRQDFAVVHIIRDAREVAASWKQDIHNSEYLKFQKLDSSSFSNVKMLKDIMYNENTCPVQIKEKLETQMHRLSQLYARDTKSVAMFKRSRCSMLYVQVNARTYSENPLKTVAKLRNILGLGNNYSITDWIRAPFTKVVDGMDRRCGSAFKMQELVPTIQNRTHYHHGFTHCNGTIKHIERIFGYPYLYDKPWGVSVYPDFYEHWESFLGEWEIPPENNKKTRPYTQVDPRHVCDTDTRNQGQWSLLWHPYGKLYADALMTRQQLDSVVPDGSRVLFVGDSLSFQFLASYRSRTTPGAKDVPGIKREKILFKKWWLHARNPNNLRTENVKMKSCVERLHENPERFEVYPAINQNSYDCLYCGLDDTSAKFKNLTIDFGVRPQPSSGHELVIIVNQCAHLHRTMEHLARCYTTLDPNDKNYLKTAQSDVLRWWRTEVADQADLYAAIKVRAKEMHNLKVRVYYRTSPPSGDIWIRERANFSMGPLPSPNEIPKAYDFNNDRNEYSHNTFGAINEMSAAAYIAAGHGVLDVEDMLGVRVDSHPASQKPVTNKADALHYCEPGPVDYALDQVLKRLWGS